VAKKGGLLQVVLPDELGHISRHGWVVVTGVMGRVAVVTQILRLTVSRELQCSQWSGGSHLQLCTHNAPNHAQGLCVTTTSSVRIRLTECRFVR